MAHANNLIRSIRIWSALGPDSLYAVRSPIQLRLISSLCLLSVQATGRRHGRTGYSVLPCHLHKSSVRLPSGCSSCLNYSCSLFLSRNSYEESNWLLKPFQRSNASTGKPGEHETFLLHIQAGVNALRRAETVLVFSGAKTERDAPSSEADSYRNILVHCFGDSDVVQRAMTDGRVLCEDAATDSYQNLLFSLIKYYEVKGKWPRMITIITHSFKEARFLVRVIRYGLLNVDTDKNRNATRTQFAGLARKYVCRG